MLLVGSTSGFGIFGAPFGVGEVKVLRGFQEAEVLFEIGEGFTIFEAFENAGFDGCANGAQEGVGVEFMTDLSSSGVLGQDDKVVFSVGAGEEAAKSAFRGGDIESALGTRFCKKGDDFVVRMLRAKVKNVLAVLFRQARELVA